MGRSEWKWQRREGEKWQARIQMKNQVGLNFLSHGNGNKIEFPIPNILNKEMSNYVRNWSYFKFGKLKKFKPNKHKTADQMTTRESIAPTTQFVFNLDGKVRHQLNSKFHKSKLYHQCHLSAMNWMELMISRNQNLQEWNWIKFEQMFEDNDLYKDSQMISSHPRQIHKFEVIFYHREDSSSSQQIPL